MALDPVKKKLYNVFNPLKPLPPDDPCYVEFNEVRGSEGLMDFMANQIVLSEKPAFQLLSGHRGCGKTSELFRLREKLENELSYFVVYCEADDYLNVNDVVEYTEVFLAVLQQLSNDADKQSISLSASKLTTFFQELWNILGSTVEFEGGAVKLSPLDLRFKLQRDPNYRLQVREYLRPRATDFLDAVNEVLERATQQLKKKNPACAGIVLIVDNLDRMLPVLLDDKSRRTSLDRLFIDAADQLTGLNCPAVYTLPPTLVHSPNGANLVYRYGSQPILIPMVPVMTPAGDEQPAGIQKLREAMQQRIAHVGAGSAFDSDDTLKRLCQISGGYIRQLMTLMRQAIQYTNELPITRDAVERAIRDARDSFDLGLTMSQGHWQILREIAAEHGLREEENPERQRARLEQFLELLNNLSILEYRDAEKGFWRDVNPVIRETKEFAA